MAAVAAAAAEAAAAGETADPQRRAARITFVSSSVLTLILAGGEGERLSILSQVRAKPGVPFGGKYRIIDFALSNAVNSGLTDVGILTQYAPRSLIDHIGVGRPWDLDRSRGGVALLQPFIGRGRARDWYRGTADAVLQNLDFIADRDPELVLILAGDHVYKMDYRPFLEMHRAKGADVTCAVRTVPIEEAHRFGILDVDRDGRVTAFIEKPPNPPSNLVSMGVYVFSWPLLRDLLSSDRVDFGRDILPAMVRGRRPRVRATSSRAIGRTSGPSRATGRRTWTSSVTTPGSSSTISAGSSTPAARSGRRHGSGRTPPSRAR